MSPRSTKSRRRQKRPFLAERFFLIPDEKKTVRAAEIEKACAVLVLAQDTRGVEVAPLRQVLEDSVQLRVDDALDLRVVGPVRRSHHYLPVALDDDVGCGAPAADDVVGEHPPGTLLHFSSSSCLDADAAHAGREAE